MKTPKNLHDKREKHVQWVTVMIKSFLHLNNHYCNHPMGKNCMWYQFVRVKSTMTIVTNVRIPPNDRTMLTCQQKDFKKDDEKTSICSCKIWNFTSLAMDVNASRTTSWNAILSPPWAQQRRWIPTGSNGWPHKQWVRPKVKGWGGLTWFAT